MPNLHHNYNYDLKGSTLVTVNVDMARTESRHVFFFSVAKGIWPVFTGCLTSVYSVSDQRLQRIWPEHLQGI